MGEKGYVFLDAAVQVCGGRMPHDELNGLYQRGLLKITHSVRADARFCAKMWLAEGEATDQRCPTLAATVRLLKGLAHVCNEDGRFGFLAVPARAMCSMYIGNGRATNTPLIGDADVSDSVTAFSALFGADPGANNCELLLKSVNGDSYVDSAPACGRIAVFKTHELVAEVLPNHYNANFCYAVTLLTDHGRQ